MLKQIELFLLYLYGDIKKRRKKMFVPPFCPNKKCCQHFEGSHTPNWYRLNGTHHTNAFGDVQRYICKSCGRTFSRQTFSLNFYAKKVIDYEEIFRQLRSTAGIRDLSRNLDVSCGSIENRIFRMAHWALAFHSLCRNYMHLNEDLVADGFEGYLRSKYFPHHLNILVGKRTQYFYAMDFTTLRRKGRMSVSQKKHRDFLDKQCRPDPKGIENSMFRLAEEMLYLFVNRIKPFINLFTDEHIAYPKAFKRHRILYKLMMHGVFNHFPEKGTKQPGRSNNLFSVNYMDRQLRKDIVNYVRSTVNTAKNVSNLLERLCVYRLHHNCVKPYRENKSKGGLMHWKLAGVNSMFVNPMIEKRFVYRPFESLLFLSPGEKGLWFRLYYTPLKKRRDPVPNYIYE